MTLEERMKNSWEMFFEDKISSTTEQSKFSEEIMENENINNIPKPSPRYGHAACKYKGNLHIY